MRLGPGLGDLVVCRPRALAPGFPLSPVLATAMLQGAACLAVEVLLGAVGTYLSFHYQREAIVFLHRQKFFAQALQVALRAVGRS